MFVKHDAASQSTQTRTGSASSAGVTRALNHDARQEVTIELILSPEAVAQVKNVGDVLRNRSLAVSTSTPSIVLMFLSKVQQETVESRGGARTGGEAKG